MRCDGRIVLHTYHVMGCDARTLKEVLFVLVTLVLRVLAVRWCHTNRIVHWFLHLLMLTDKSSAFSSTSIEGFLIERLPAALKQRGALSIKFLSLHKNKRYPPYSLLVSLRTDVYANPPRGGRLSIRVSQPCDVLLRPCRAGSQIPNRRERQPQRRGSRAAGRARSAFASVVPPPFADRHSLGCLDVKG
jgi:hypothetical protein